ncbi:MAG: PKD domain-containing protein, partial [Bacteroidetes bacterium]|nr:PKD domain-containing protein [Bacteroidota bacterium]
GNTSFSVSVTATFTSTGCTGTASAAVQVNKRPEATLVDLVNTPEFINCNGGIFSLSVGDGAVNTYTNYLISWGDGSANYTSTTPPSTSPGVPHSYSTLGFKTILYTVSNSNGCTTTSTYSAFNGGNPQVGLANPGGTTGLCTPTTLSFPISNYSNNAPGTIYVVTTNDGTPADTFQHPPPTSYVHQFTKTSCGSTSPGYPNSFYVRIEAINPCASSSATVEPITTNALPNVDFSISPDSIACVNSTVTFTNTSFGGAWVNAQNQCDTTKISNWKITPVTGYTINSGSLGNNPPSVNLPGTWGSGALGVAFNTIGTYSIKLRVRTKNACGYDTIVKTVCIQPVPVPAFSLNSIIGCAPLSITATNSSNTLNTCSPATYGWAVTYVASNCGTTSAFSFTGGTSASSISPSFVFTNPGTYTVTLSVTNKCGTFTSQKVVTVKEKPSVLVSTSPPSACSSPASTIPTLAATNCGANAMTYAWTFAGGTPATSAIENPGSISFSSLGVHTISVSVTNECGTTVGTTPFTISTIPNPPVVPNVSPVCIGDSIHLFASNVAGASYSWTGPSGFTSTQQNPGIGNAQLANAGAYSVTVTVNGCTSSPASKTVTVNPQPTVNVNSPAICIGLSATLTASGANTYSWTPNTNISGIIGASVTANPTSTISYTVTGTNTTTGCKNTAVSLVTVNPLPVVNAGPSITLCNLPVPNTLTGYSPAGGTWTGAGVTGAGVFTPSGTGTIILTYSFSDGNCSAQDTMKITVIAPQTVNAGTGFAICENISAQTLTGYTPPGGTWSGAGIIGNSFDPAAAGPGIHILTYSLGSGTCLTTDTIKVNVKASPTVTVNSPTICAGQTIILTASGADSYSWAPNTNLSAVTGASVSANPSSTISYTLTGTTTLTGCTKTAVSSVTVNPLPVVDAGASVLLCYQPTAYTLTGFSPTTGGTGVWTGTGVTAAGIYTPYAVVVDVLTYTFTDLNTCVNSDTIKVTVVTPEVADAGGNDTLCLNDGLFNLSGFSPSTGTWTGVGISSPGGGFDPLLAGVGTHLLTLSYGTGTCFTSDTKKITVKPIPVINPGLDEITCISDTEYILPGFSPAGGTWTGTGITNGTTGAFDPAVANIGINTLTYSFTDPVTLCTNTGTKTVTVGALPVVAFSKVLSECVNIPVLFTNSTTGASNFQWDFGDGGTSTDVSTSHSYTSAGTFTIKLVSYSILGCTDSLSDTIHIIVPPTSGFTVVSDTGCAPLLTDFNNTTTGLGNTSALNVPVAQTYLQGLYDTTYYVTLTVTNLCGVSTKTDSIFVMPTPAVNFGTNVSSGCSPLLITMNNNSTGNAGQYIWDYGDGSATVSAINPPSHVFTTGVNDTIYKIKLIGSNPCGADTITKTILVHPNTINAFFNTSSISGCSPHTVTFSDFSSGGTFISWDFGDGNAITSTNAVHTYLAAGTYICRQFVNNGCSFDTASVSITVYPPPTLSFTVDVATVCVNQPVTFNNTSTNSVDFVWNFGDGDTSNLSNPSHSYINSGNYTVQLIGTSTIYGCIDTVTQTVSVNTAVIPQISSNTLFGCEPFISTFSNTSQNALFYSWDFNDGNVSVFANPVHTFSSAGIYYVNMVAQSLDGCKDSAQIQINVYPNPLASFSLSSVYSCFIPTSVNFTNNSIGGNGYQWDFDNGANSVLTNPSTNYNAVGQFNPTLITSNSYGCLDTAINTFTVYATPIAAFSPSLVGGCEPLTISFTNQSQNGLSYSWNFGDGGTSLNSNSDHIFQNPGNYNVTLITNNGMYCADTLQYISSFTVNPKPFADFSVNQVYSSGIPVGTLQYLNSSLNVNSYLWDFGDGNSSNFENPQHQYNVFGTYTTTLITTNQYGCIDTVRNDVNPDYFQGLFVPNALMPNFESSEANLFLPKGKSLQTYHLQIFNSWGTLLFESTALDASGSPSEGWNGVFEGKECPQDVYVWEIDATFVNGNFWFGKLYPNGKFSNTGTVTLIK